MVGAGWGVRWAPWAISAAAGVLMLRAMLGQAALQADLNQAMVGVLANVRAAGALTGETAEALQPMAATAAKLAAMNERMRAAQGDLAHMNATLGRVLAMQRSMRAQIDPLNEKTGGVVTALEGIDSQNRAMLQTSAALARQTGEQAGLVERLSELTEEAIGYLRSMNRRLGFLR